MHPSECQLLQRVMGKESTVTVAARVANILGAPVLEFNGQCGILGMGGTLMYASCFPSCLGKRGPEEWVCSNGRHCRGPEHMVKSTGSRDRAPKFRSPWAGQLEVSFLPPFCLSFLTRKVGRLKIVLHQRVWGRPEASGQVQVILAARIRSLGTTRKGIWYCWTKKYEH